MSSPEADETGKDQPGSVTVAGEAEATEAPDASAIAATAAPEVMAGSLGEYARLWLRRVRSGESGALVAAMAEASGASVASASPATATDPGCSWAVSSLSGDDIPQPSAPLPTLPEAAGSLASPSCRRPDAPVVMRSTTDAVSNSALGPTAASRPR